MGGWGFSGTIKSKGFEYEKDPCCLGYDEYPLKVPEVFLEGLESASTQGWGDYWWDDVVLKRENEIVVYKRQFTKRRWIELEGKRILCDEEDVPDGCETLGIEYANNFSIIVYNLQTKTKCVYNVFPKKEHVPFNERDVRKYLKESETKAE